MSVSSAKDANNIFFPEDLKVGRRFFSRNHEVDITQILRFGEAYDPQPAYLDPELAREDFQRTCRQLRDHRRRCEHHQMAKPGPTERYPPRRKSNYGNRPIQTSR